MRRKIGRPPGAIALTLTGLTLSLLAPTLPAAIAHKVKISGEIGATKHIEPNDNPRAGEPSLVWFALTRQGGEIIPLEQCNCRLSLHSQPYQPGTLALAEPSLKPISAEGFKNIPGATVTFPQVGAYILRLQGTPRNEGNFQPFELSFDVTVAAGQTNPPLPTSIAPRPTTNQPATPTPETPSPTAPTTQTPPDWAIALSVIGGIAILGAIAQHLLTSKHRPLK